MHCFSLSLMDARRFVWIKYFLFISKTGPQLSKYAMKQLFLEPLKHT